MGDDLTALIAAADLTWTHEFGDEPSQPAYIRHLARCVAAGRALPYEPAPPKRDLSSYSLEELRLYIARKIGDLVHRQPDTEATTEPVSDTELRDRFVSILGEDVSEFMHPDEFGGYDIDYGRLAEIAHEFYAPALKAEYLRGHDAGFAAANVADPWVEPVVDSELRDRIAGRLVAEFHRQWPENNLLGTEWRDFANEALAEVAPVLAERAAQHAADSATIEQTRIRLAEAMNLSHARTLDELLTDVAELADAFVNTASRNAERDELTSYNQGLRAEVWGLRAELDELRLLGVARDIGEANDRMRAQLEALKAGARLVWLPEFYDEEEIQLGEPTVHNRCDGRFVLRWPDTEATEQACGAVSPFGDPCVLTGPHDDHSEVAPATPTEPRVGDPAEPREGLGRMVRQIWVEWAREQVAPKLSWLLPWESLGAGQREVDMRIGAVLFEAGQRSMEQPVTPATPTGPISTLTGQPCTHAPDMRCVECVGDDEARVKPLGPATPTEPRAVYHEPGGVEYEYDEDDNPIDPSVGWGIAFGCRVSFGWYDGGWRTTVSVSDAEQRNGGAIRSVTRKQIREFAHHLIALTEAVGDQAPGGES